MKKLPLTRTLAVLGAVVLISAVPGGLLLGHLDTAAWPAVQLPISAIAFSVIFSLVAANVRRRWLAAALWAIGLHLAVWTPFLFLGYLDAQGVERIGHVLMATAVTGFAVAWYLMTDMLWETGIAAVVFWLVLRVAARLRWQPRRETE